MTREVAIRNLEMIRIAFVDPVTKEQRKLIDDTIDMAIASLKTDEAYQLEYENRDFVEIHKGMTNGEVMMTLFPNESKEQLIWFHGEEWWNSPYQKDGE